jgi:hypothetical protein
MTAPTCLTLPITLLPVPQSSTAPAQTSTWMSPGRRGALKRPTNYHAKILGACSTQLIIKAAITGCSVLGHGPLTVGCNNMGVVQHDNSPQCPMLEKLPQSDVLQYFKGLMASSRIGGRMQQVYGHTDKYLLEAEMSPAQQVNCRANKLATAALIAMVEVNIHLKHLSVGKNLHRKCRGMGYGVSQKCNHRALGRTGDPSTV